MKLTTRKITIMLFLLLQIFAVEINAKTKKQKIIAIEYFNKIYGHIHQHPSRYSESLSTISCGHPIKIYGPKKGPWALCKAGPYKGHILKKFLSKKRPICFQDRYPKFFEQFKLEISDLYYWGKLNDLYIQGKSKIK